MANQNPIFKQIDKLQREQEPQASIARPMTLDDVIMRSGMLFVVLLIGAGVGWLSAPTMPFLWIGAAIVGLVLGLVNSFKKKVSVPLIFAYAAVEGVFLGGISYFYNELGLAMEYDGLVQQAVLGTLVAFGVMLLLYRFGIIKVNGRFMKIMMVAMVSYLGIALVSLVSAFFGVGQGWGFYGVGGWGILLCVVGVGLAAFSLNMDFENITQGVKQGWPEEEAWRCSFGLLVTLIWLYLEILRLLAIIASNRD